MSKYRNEQEYLAKQVVGLPINQKAYIHNLYPCYLGILFIGKMSTSILEKIKIQLELVFDSFFFDITFFGEKKKETCLSKRHTKEEHNLLDKSLDKVVLFPTNMFYSNIKTYMVKERTTMGLGLTNVPIYSSSDEKLLFLFGEANLKHNCAIVSTHNLVDLNKSDTTEHRLIKEVIHEIGHIILGHTHCFSENCVMQFSYNTKEIDRKSNHLCEKCKLKLENIRTISNF
jgi:predicted Zn-dependent protease